MSPARRRPPTPGWSATPSTGSASSSASSKWPEGYRLIDRRAFLAAGSALVAAPTLARGWKPACPYPVNAAPDRLIRSVVGLRPFRPSGFRVEREALGAKSIVHNYGHGGG